MSCTKPLTLLVLTALSKIAFGIFFTAGSILHRSDQILETFEFCTDIDQDSSVPDLFYCWRDLKDGLLFTGAILFLISIILEAFGPNKILIGGTIVPTIFNGLGSVFLIIGCMYKLFIAKDDFSNFFDKNHQYYGKNYTLFDIDNPFFNGDFEAGFWLAGGLITALAQAYLAFALRKEGIFVIITYFFAIVGSSLFMVVGIMWIEDVAEQYTNYYDKDYRDTVAAILISGSVFYTVHGILYPVATYRKIKDLTTNQENPSITVANPNVYHNEKNKPENHEEEC